MNIRLDSSLVQEKKQEQANNSLKKCSRHSFYRMKSTEQIEFIRKLLIQNLFECKGRARAREKEQRPTSTQQLNSCI